MKPFHRALLLAAAIVIAPGMDWSFNIDNPPQYWKEGNGAIFYINTSIPQDFQIAIESAAQQWNGHADWAFFYGGLTFASYATVDQTSVVDYISRPDRPNVAGFTVQFNREGDLTDINEVDTAFNTEVPLGTDGSATVVDVQSVATHEFGHWLVLLESEDPYSVMRPISLGEVRRFLSLDDVEGVQYLYPAGGGPPGSGGGPAGGGKICHKVGSCNVCEQVQNVTMTTALYKPQIEALDFGGLQTFMLQKPQSRALLFAILNDLPELEDISLNYEEPITQAWQPITKDWLPGLYWLSGDLGRGQNLVLTKERAAAFNRGLAVIRAHSSYHLKRDLDKTERFIRTHVGRNLEGMRSELFEEYQALTKPQPPGR